MAEEIIKNITKLMKCNSCANYLRPPIYNLEDGYIICEHCKPVKFGATAIVPNIALESIGTLLKFPCSYKNFGCKVDITWEEATKHENDCPLRQFSCPRCTGEDFNAASMKDHVKEIHVREILTQPFRFVLQNGSAKLFTIQMQELYVLIYNCDQDSGLLWFSLKAVGPLDYVKRRHFKITLKLHEGVQYSQRKQVEGGVNWEIDEDTAIKIDMSVLRTKLQLRNENVVDLYVEIFSRIPLYNGNVDEGLLRDIECPVCHDFMSLPVYQCSIGHSFCSYCKPKLKMCPVCRGNMSDTRNFVLESICNKMYYKCMYADDGCKFAALPKDIIGHESMCDFGLYDCPLKFFIGGCKWRGKLDHISSHTLDEHGIKI